MNATQLLAHFDRLAETPNAVQRLRRFILDLAVRGKLVEQDAGDEPAAELLNRIKLNSMQLVTSGKPHKVKPLSPIAIHEEPYPAPRGWSWVRMGLIGETNIGLTYSPSNLATTGTPVLRSSNVQDGKLDLSDLVRVDFDVKDSVLVGEGDLLICARNGSKALVGKTALISGLSERMAFGAFMAIFRSPYNAYLLRFINSPLFRTMISEVNTTTINQITQENLKSALLPFPPLAEQNRIVAKVDELMALCDQLEAAQQERERRRDRLAAASLQRLNQPAADTSPEAQRGHARFHLQHLPRLTTRPEHVKAMRKLILDLAIKGKLVAQDEGDEPASEFINQIQTYKASLVKTGLLKEQWVVVDVPRTAQPFPVRSNWKWATFGSVMISRDSERIPVSKEERNTRAKVYDYYGASGTIDKIDGFLFDKPLLLIGEDGANLINRSTPIAFIARGKYWVNNHAHVLDGVSENFLKYIELYVNAIDLKAYVTGTAQPKMNQAKMNSIPVAIPPENEQYRIVAKVDELMALCDQLEAQLTTTKTDSHRLLEAVLRVALTPVN